MEAKFEGGRNIAMKVPPHRFEATVRFYREVLGLPQVERLAPDVVFAFGANQLWIDRAPGMTQAELWLEVTAEDSDAAAEYLADAGVTRRDEVEALPAGFGGFWISSPCDLIHLVRERDS